MGPFLDGLKGSYGARVGKKKIWDGRAELRRMGLTFGKAVRRDSRRGGGQRAKNKGEARGDDYKFIVATKALMGLSQSQKKTQKKKKKKKKKKKHTPRKKKPNPPPPPK